MSLEIEELLPADQNKVIDIVTQLWGDAVIVVHGDVFHSAELPGLKALIDNQIVGILHFQIDGRECEILILASLREGQGVGSALLTAVEALAKSHGCDLLSLITTNDNLHALGFYQRRGFHLVALYPGQVAVSRQIKPNIPLIGEHAIPLRDELRLEKRI